MCELADGETFGGGGVVEATESRQAAAHQEPPPQEQECHEAPQREEAVARQRNLAAAPAQREREDVIGGAHAERRDPLLLGEHGERSAHDAGRKVRPRRLLLADAC